MVVLAGLSGTDISGELAVRLHDGVGVFDMLLIAMMDDLACSWFLVPCSVA